VQVRAVKDKHRDFLRSLPNVTGVGVGQKITKGVHCGPVAVKVYVSKKVPLDELAPEDRVPSELDGFPTDVELLGPLQSRLAT